MLRTTHPALPAPRALPCLCHAPVPCLACASALPCPRQRPARTSALPAPAPCTVRPSATLPCLAAASAALHAAQHAAQRCPALPGRRQHCPTRCPVPRCAALPRTPARCPAPPTSRCLAQRIVSAPLSNVPCTPSCPTCSRCLRAPALPRAYRQLPLSPAHAPTCATTTAPTAAATAPTVPATATAVATLNLAPLLLTDIAYHGHYQRGGSGGGQQQQQQRPLETLSPQQLQATSLGACDSASAGAEPEEALHTFTLDAGTSHCFFRDSTIVTPLAAPVPITVADPSGGPVVACGAIVLPCLAAPSGLLTGLHLPSFAKNLVATSILQD
ncbi:unnamed protein product [Closterium sp. NIES-54]